MEEVTMLEELVVLVGSNTQDEPTAYVVGKRSQIWRNTSILWSKLGTELIEVYEISLGGKIKTISMGDVEE
jgi:hypothetical protein